jgi:hypothetical protein
VLLLHFSCHGLKSDSGELFFAARNTRPNRLGSTAIPADFVQRCMRASRSRSIVLLLDCCYGGAFSQGVSVRAAGDVNVVDSFPGGRLGDGRGRAVITASSSMEYAFEGDQLADDQNRRPSVFTSALVEGLATGNADRDQDGWISLNELYDYVFDRVREQNQHQTPSREVEMQGELYLARRSRPVTTPAPLPSELQQVVDHPLAGVRAGAVQELARAWPEVVTLGWPSARSWPLTASPTTTAGWWRQRHRLSPWISGRSRTSPAHPLPRRKLLHTRRLRRQCRLLHRTPACRPLRQARQERPATSRQAMVGQAHHAADGSWPPREPPLFSGWPAPPSRCRC